jgi:hypothetical protein
LTKMPAVGPKIADGWHQTNLKKYQTYIDI